MGVIKDYEKISKQVDDMLDRMYTQDTISQIKIERLEKALYLACCELEEKDSILYDLYDRYHTYHDIKDRYEWKKYLLESVNEDE